MTFNHLKILSAGFSALIFTSAIYAEPVKIVGSFQQTIPSNEKGNKAKFPNAKVNSPALKQVTLLKIALSPEALAELKQRSQSALTKDENAIVKTNAAHSSHAVQLGMNGVPVLNQGEHGTCVTFANTAAYDAALGKGDYISQLCQLTLGRYLENNSYTLSGWDGSLGRFSLDQIDSFGIINKDHQSKYGCGGIYEYPLEAPDPESSMNIEEYKQYSEAPNISWSPVLDVIEAFTDHIDPSITLAKVKTALGQGDRLTFATLIVDIDLGLAGAVGSYHTPMDTWVLTPAMTRDVYLNPEFAAHEMVITGYDDNAIAVDNEGRKHRGLLTLRNSWGTSAGDHGDFYMSYDYFELLVIEVNRIRNPQTVS